VTIFNLLFHTHIILLTKVLWPKRCVWINFILNRK